MAETVNIAKMAEKLSGQLFSEFLWGVAGPTNQNWACENERHKAGTHPSDAVFYYDEPYRKARTYVNCDLKSYAQGSLKPHTIKSAIQSLARSLSCLEKSEQWRKLYIHDYVSPEMCGLLFVYNHDGEYDKNFRQHLCEIKSEELEIPKGSKIVVLGPQDIFWLDNVRYDIVHMRGNGLLPQRTQCRYHYPHLVRHPNLQLKVAKAATLEMLTAPWIMLEYDGQPAGRRGLVLYYRRRGESSAEFLYLIDYLKHYQILGEDTDVTIKLLDAAPTATATFTKAVQQYAEGWGENTEISARLHEIKCERMTQLITKFSEIELGMGPL